MLGLILLLAAFFACFIFLIKAVGAMKWHGGMFGPGIGERKAKAEFGRIKREAPQSADAQLSEGEFVDKFVSARSKPWVYGLITVAICVLVIPVSCTMMISAM